MKKYDDVGESDNNCNEYDLDHCHNIDDNKNDKIIDINMYLTFTVTMNITLLLVMDDGRCRMEKLCQCFLFNLKPKGGLMFYRPGCNFIVNHRAGENSPANSRQQGTLVNICL